MTAPNIRFARSQGASARFGIARWDITPGLEVSVKNWGATDRWFARGVHRPLTGTALAIAPLDPEGQPLVLLSLDLGWWRGARADVDWMLGAFRAALSLPAESIIIHITHTHAGPFLDREAPPEADPETVRSYMDRLQSLCIEGAQAAVRDLRPGSLLSAVGSCGLAANRDLPDPTGADRYLTGFCPHAAADDTLVVARIFDEAKRTRATLVNYACHPTTLGWENDLLSPDFPGAMREVVESATSAPCLFLQGASGELAPPCQYSGDPSLADRHGRVLGYAAMALLENLADGAGDLVFDGCKESGAPLALWTSVPGRLPETVAALRKPVELELKPDLPTVAQLQSQLEEGPTGFAHERLIRKLRVRASVGDGATSREHIWLWQIGALFLVAVPFEAYSDLQREIRAYADGNPVLVLNLSNGNQGYLPPAQLYEKNIYTVWQTPFAKGSLEALISAVRHHVADRRSFALLRHPSITFKSSGPVR